MANSYLNVLRVSGSRKDVDDFVRDASGETAPLDFGKLVAGTAVGEPEEGMEAPVRFEERDLSVVGYTFSTRGDSPLPLFREAAADRSSLTFRLATVEPANGIARVDVLRGEQSWSYEMSDGEQEEHLDAESGYADEESVLDALESSSDSVVDDYERSSGPVARP